MFSNDAPAQGSRKLYVAAAKICQWSPVTYARRFNFANDDCVISSRICMDHAAFERRQSAFNQRRSVSTLTVGCAVESLLVFRGEASRHQLLVLLENVDRKVGALT